jgi:hypothetical protein
MTVRLRVGAVEVVDCLAAPDVAQPSLFRLLVKIDCSWPETSPRDFISALVIAGMLRNPKGNA